jgi:hypothetical protein
LLWEGQHKDFCPHLFIDTKFYGYENLAYMEAVPLCKESICDEGIVIRKE